jgi:hypothetical protein
MAKITSNVEMPTEATEQTQSVALNEVLKRLEALERENQALKE